MLEEKSFSLGISDVGLYNISWAYKYAMPITMAVRSKA
jgi:hypothetical protein